MKFVTAPLLIKVGAILLAVGLLVGWFIPNFLIGDYPLWVSREPGLELIATLLSIVATVATTVGAPLLAAGLGAAAVISATKGTIPTAEADD
ncbi:hypothetical protein [Puerhibacterium puerhi]|uniref:hypothetical protein n=1 Tax=Puerhibacterium puerhi TaxID=2692623 RepID=UPI00135B66DC|nr:hypothetical protein [Puerhibacterium puerhi]